MEPPFPPFGSDLLNCPCGGRKRVIATIHAGPVVTRILKHVGLSAEPEDFCEIRGPPDAFEPLDDGWGSPANDDAVDMPLFDDAV